MSRRNAENLKNTRTVEHIVLAIVILYNFSMVTIAIKEDWSWLSILAIYFGLILSAIITLTKFKEFRQRAYVTTALLELSIVIYTTNCSDMSTGVYLLVSTLIVVCLFEIPKLVWIVSIASTLVFARHFLGGGIRPDTAVDSIRVVLQVSVTYISQIVVYYMLCRQNESDKMLLDTIEDLEDLEQSKDDFLANVSHELRTPINTICGMSEILLREELPDLNRKKVEDIQTSGKILMSVVSDILDFSELQSGNIDLVEEPYCIENVVNDVLHMLMPRKSEKDLEVIVDCDANIPKGLLGDEGKIKRVLVNLVDNAIKFTNEGGIAIILEQRKTDYGINLIVRVADTGIGMKEENLEKIFTTFSQVDAKRNRMEGGTGLGLAISRALVEAMGGYINVKSEWGKGTEVQFVVPQKIVDPEPTAKVKTPENLNVLIWINLEWINSIEIRDYYTESIKHMLLELGVKGHICQSMSELKRKTDWERFSHIFIGTREYKSDSLFFGELAKTTKISVIIDVWETEEIRNPDLIQIVKPMSVFSVVPIVNNEGQIQESGSKKSKVSFTAPEACVLVVDDNLINLRVIEGILGFYQIKTVLAMSGIEALEKIESKEYDMVFMDHMMPEMDGVETFHLLRRKNGNYFKQVPVIALTANAVGGMKEMFLKEGFQDFVSKPVELSSLERVLKKYLPENKIISAKKTQQTGDGAEVPTVKHNRREIGNLNVEAGITFCGTWEGLLSVLGLLCRNGKEDRERIDSLYQKRDWKNYTIAVHGLKGSMRSVGNEKLSRMAADLERAARKENYEFVMEHHGAMLEEYAEFLDILKADERVASGDESDMEEQALPEIEAEVVHEVLRQMENCVLELQGDKITSLLQQLKAYSYRGHALKKHLELIEKKVDMSDYMSAYQTLERLVKEWEQS